MADAGTPLAPGTRLVQFDALRELAAVVGSFHHLRHCLIQAHPLRFSFPSFEEQLAQTHSHQGLVTNNYVVEAIFLRFAGDESTFDS
jgi:hypothetical protein